MRILQLENLRNFLTSKDCIVVLTLTAWAAIVTSAHWHSQGLQVGKLHSRPTFFFDCISGLLSIIIAFEKTRLYDENFSPLIHPHDALHCYRR